MHQKWVEFFYNDLVGSDVLLIRQYFMFYVTVDSFMYIASLQLKPGSVLPTEKLRPLQQWTHEKSEIQKSQFLSN